MIRRLTRSRAALILILVAVAVLIIYLIPDTFLAQTVVQLRNFPSEGAALRARILAQGQLAPLLFILIQTAQVVVAPIPGEASGILGGYLFGTWPGFIYSSLGLTLGSSLAFAGGRLLAAFFSQHFRDTSLYHRFNHLISTGDFVVPFVLFLLPGFPKDSLCYLLGMSTMPWPVYLVIAGVGRMPGTLLLSVQGAEAGAGNWQRFALILLVSLALVVPCLLYRHRLLEVLSRRSKRLAPEDSHE